MFASVRSLVVIIFPIFRKILGKFFPVIFSKLSLISLETFIPLLFIISNNSIIWEGLYDIYNKRKGCQIEITTNCR